MIHIDIESAACHQIERQWLMAGACGRQGNCAVSSGCNTEWALAGTGGPKCKRQGVCPRPGLRSRSRV